MKTALALGLILIILFPQMSLPRVSASPGIILVPGPYPNIQAAINAANPGDTVLVSSGNYSEHLSISKSLNLTGVSMSNTVINGTASGPGIQINTTTDVWVSGFTIINTGSVYNGIIVSSSSSVHISHVKVKASAQSDGVDLLSSSSVSLTDSIVTGNGNGIIVQGGYTNQIQRNNVTGNAFSDLEVSGSSGNKITDNHLRKSQYGLELGPGSATNVIARNLVANNTVNGIFLWNSTGNLVVENSIGYNKNSKGDAAGLQLQNSVGNRFYRNNISYNDVQVFGVFNIDITNNTWNDGAFMPRGNYWSDYRGSDSNGDGVGDTNLPHPCPSGGPPCSFGGPKGVDYYPLMSPWLAPVLNATAAGTPGNGLAPLTVSFAGLAKGGTPPYGYAWDFGNGGMSQAQNATQIYLRIGSFVATLTVMDNGGLSRSDWVPIVVPGGLPGTLNIFVLTVDGGAISGANVTFVAQPKGQSRLSVRTGVGGLAGFQGLVPGNYTIQASNPGYKTAEANVTVDPGQTVSKTIALSLAQKPADLLPVVIAVAAAGVLAVAGIAFFFWRRSRKRSRQQLA